MIRTILLLCILTFGINISQANDDYKNFEVMHGITIGDIEEAEKLFGPSPKYM